MVLSVLTYVVTNGRISLFLKAEYVPLYVFCYDFLKFALVKWSIRWAEVQQQTRREIEIEVYYSEVLEVFGKPNP